MNETQVAGFIAGLQLTRKGLDDGGDDDRTDPFMVAYRRGAAVREEITEEATRRAVAELDEQRRGS